MDHEEWLSITSGLSAANVYLRRVEALSPGVITNQSIMTLLISVNNYFAMIYASFDQE